VVVLSVPRAAGQNPVRGPMDILAFPRQALAASHGRYASGAYGTDTTLIVADANPRASIPATYVRQHVCPARYFPGGMLSKCIAIVKEQNEVARTVLQRPQGHPARWRAGVSDDKVETSNVGGSVRRGDLKRMPADSWSR
jgi:hypothetical protein